MDRKHFVDEEQLGMVTGAGDRDETRKEEEDIEKEMREGKDGG